MKRRHRLEIANWAIRTLPPRVVARGNYLPNTAANQPAHWEWNTGDFLILFADGILLSSDDQSTSKVLDVWARPNGPKLMSISWPPSRPWMPPRIASLHTGDWLERLGWFPGDAES